MLWKKSYPIISSVKTLEGKRLSAHDLAWRRVHMSYSLQANLNVSDGLNHPDWDGVYKGDDDRKDERPDGELRVPNFDGNHSKDKRDDPDSEIVPLRYFRVCQHKSE